jgi:hypothetical protein
VIPLVTLSRRRGIVTTIPFTALVSRSSTDQGAELWQNCWRFVSTPIRHRTRHFAARSLGVATGYRTLKRNFLTAGVHA